MDDQDRQAIIVRQSCLKAAATTLATIAKERFADADAAASFVEALTKRYEEFIWNGQEAPTQTVEQHPNAVECPIHHKSKEGKYGLYCPSKLADGSWCQWKPKQ